MSGIFNPAQTAGDSPIRLAGYAAIFFRRDCGGDVILPGAFAATLANWRLQGAAIPLLWQHRQNRVIGVIEHAAEDDRGLRVIARLDASPEAARMAATRGLSFGYRLRSGVAETLPQGRSGRQLAQVDLTEISLVTHPMQPWAAVHLVL